MPHKYLQAVEHVEHVTVDGSVHSFEQGLILQRIVHIGESLREVRVNLWNIETYDTFAGLFCPTAMLCILKLEEVFTSFILHFNTISLSGNALTYRVNFSL